MSTDDKATRDFTASNYYIAYFDILGYEHMMKTDKDITNLSKKIYDAIEDIVLSKEVIADVYAERYDETNDPNIVHGEIRHKVFSDNFLICSKTNWSGLMYVAYNLQRFLIQEGLFIRGAICYGSLYFSEDFICGTGIISAYKLENEISIFPRVIIAESFLHAIEEDSLPEYSFIDEIIDFDFDNHAFINYLIDYIDYEAFLPTHKQVIERRLSEHKNNPRILQKYQWCKTYHNNFCNTNGFTEHLISN